MTSDESQPRTEAPIDPDKNQPGVLCTRCDHLNYLGQEKCEDCGAPLFVKCTHCGEQSPRVFSRCPHCHHRLRHRGRHGHRKHHGGSRRGLSSSERATRQLMWILGVVLALFAIAALILSRLKS